MSIEKKSLISTLKTTKKANAVKDDITGAVTVSAAQKLPVDKKLGGKKFGGKKFGGKKFGGKKFITKQ
jgi:hypothetical protein